MDEDKVTPAELMAVSADLVQARADFEEERREHQLTRQELDRALKIITFLQRELGEELVLSMILRRFAP